MVVAGGGPMILAWNRIPVLPKVFPHKNALIETLFLFVPAMCRCFYEAWHALSCALEV